jgi:tetratricopeptide (TPR) repeat protein
VTYFYLGDYDGALRGFDLDSASSFSFTWKAIVYALSEDRERAMACIDRVLRSEPRSAFGVICAALKLYLERRHDLFKESLRSAELMNVIDGENWYNLAQLYGLANDPSGAARTLARAIDAGFFNYPLMLVDPLFSGVRDSPEFKRVLATARKKYEAFKERYPELRDAS